MIFLFSNSSVRLSSSLHSLSGIQTKYALKILKAKEDKSRAAFLLIMGSNISSL